jgi:hypothetical protein
MSKRVDYIIPECFIDTNLIETVYRNGEVNHQKGCNTVANEMKKINGMSIAITDDDKRKSSYEKDFHMVAHSDHIKLKRHNDSKIHKYILTVSKAQEDFILANATKEQLRVCELPTNLDKLKKETKNSDSKKDSRFKRLFQMMKDSDEMEILRETVKQLDTNKYSTTDDQLRAIFTKHGGVGDKA